MLKKIYGPKTDKISGRQAGRQAGNLTYNTFCDFYGSFSNVNIVKCRKL